MSICTFDVSKSKISLTISSDYGELAARTAKGQRVNYEINTLFCLMFFFFILFFPSISVIYILLVTLSLSHSVLLILIIHEANFLIVMHLYLPEHLYVHAYTGLDRYRTRSLIVMRRERSDCYFQLLFCSLQEKNKTRCLS